MGKVGYTTDFQVFNTSSVKLDDFFRRGGGGGGGGKKNCANPIVQYCRV